MDAYSTWAGLSGDMYTSVRPYCLILRSAGMVYDPMRRVGRSRNIRNEEEDGTDREDEDEEGYM